MHQKQHTVKSSKHLTAADIGPTGESQQDVSHHSGLSGNLEAMANYGASIKAAPSSVKVNSSAHTSLNGNQRFSHL